VFFGDLGDGIKLLTNRLPRSFVGIVQHLGILYLSIIERDGFEDSMKIDKKGQNSDHSDADQDPHENK
jgi:hypothetical protein